METKKTTIVFHMGPLGCDFHDAAAAAAAYFVLQSTVLARRMAAAVLLPATIPIRLTSKPALIIL